MRVRAAICVFFVSSTAAAQLPSIDIRTWRPSVDPSASLVLESPNTPGPWAVNFGSYLDWQFRPVSVKDGTGATLYRPIDSGFGLNVIANIGLGEHASLGVVVPAVFGQTGSDSLPANVASRPVAGTALADLGLSAKVKIIDNRNGGFGLAALAGITVPTGDQSSFAGEGAVTANLRVIADYSFVIAHFQASLGYFIRTEQRTWPDASAGGVNFGDEIPWSVGFRIRPDVFHIDKEDRQTWEIAAHGWLPAGPQAPFVDKGASALSPAMLAVSDRITIGHDKDAYITAGVDIGLSDAVGVPGFRVVAGIGWAPREHDKDHDGVPDDVDQCEDIPEDRDGFEDSDGCPDIDNDQDGIIDREDACPNVAGPKSEDPKLNGCPHEVKVEPPKPVEPPPPDPNKDDDGDGILNGVDACPDKPGEPSTDPKMNGCPNPDRDGDTYPNEQDECPDSAEVFNGVKDEDGCPDEGGKPLVTVDAKLVIKLQNAIKLAGTADAAGHTPEGGPTVDPSSTTTLRAIALELNKHRDWTLAVAARPSGTDAQAQAEALARALAVVNALTALTHRDGSAETVGWDAVKNAPTAASGIGLMLFAAPATPPAQQQQKLEKKP
ncbi:MAG TPA: thrombospondin type 3 repeat-containing protein [Polyangiaceae bacterium]